MAQTLQDLIPIAKAYLTRLARERYNFKFDESELIAQTVEGLSGWLVFLRSKKVEKEIFYDDDGVKLSEPVTYIENDPIAWIEYSGSPSFRPVPDEPGLISFSSNSPRLVIIFPELFLFIGSNGVAKDASGRVVLLGEFVIW